MGYIIIDEEKLNERLRVTNDRTYIDRVKFDVATSKADCSHMLEALTQEEQRINEKIADLKKKKNDIGMLMNMASGGKE